MRRLLLTAALTAAALASQTTAAHADASLREYKDAMRTFVPVMAAWTAEADTFGDIALTKPELACKPEAAEMARRGMSMVDDLAGTAAPEALATAQLELGTAMADMADALNTGCGSDVSLAAALAPSIVKADRALVTIRRFVESGIAPIALPIPMPGSTF